MPFLLIASRIEMLIETKKKRIERKIIQYCAQDLVFRISCIFIIYIFFLTKTCTSSV